MAGGADLHHAGLSPLLQELIDREGWTAGQAVALIFSVGEGQREASSWDQNPADAPLLYVEFGGGPANRAPVVDAGAAQTVTVGEVVMLEGSVTDDGLPDGTLTTNWVDSGPARVDLADPGALVARRRGTEHADPASTRTEQVRTPET